MAPAAVTGSMGPGLPTNTQHKSVTAGSYYAQLEVSRDASAQEINKAFRKLALKHHPDKHDGAEEAVLAFRAVAEAYEVLSNPAHRALYDQYEETGLKDGVPDGRGGLIGGTYRFSGDPQRIFETFFGSSSPFGDLYGALSDPASATPDTAEPAFYGELTSLAKPVSATQPRPVTRTVPVTLGQLYRGDLLTLPHSRKKLNGDGVTTTAVDEELRLQIQPGWASGYKVRARPPTVGLAAQGPRTRRKEGGRFQNWHLPLAAAAAWLAVVLVGQGGWSGLFSGACEQVLL